MSSIYGAVYLNGNGFEDQIIQRIDAATGWWSPDYQHIFTDQQTILGQQTFYKHSRSQLESSNIFKHASGLKIVSDARLDNRKELSDLLNIEDQLSDSKLILNLYIKYGYDCVQHLLGAFAFAIWDPKKKSLFCVRDQMGIRPLHYYCKDGFFAFGTQKKSITCWPRVDKTPNWRQIFNSQSSLGIPAESTAYLHIQHVPPGHFMVFNNKGVEIKKYWELDIEQRTTYQNDKEYIEEFKEHFQRAISCRMDTLQKVGTHLSGGLDSSGISSVAFKLAKEKGSETALFSYNVPRGFEGDEKHLDENLKAFDLIDFLDAEEQFHNVSEPIQRDFKIMVEHEAQSCDGISRSNNVNTEYEIQAAAHNEGVDVMLSGFPGDELVTSFCRPFYLEYLDRGQWVKYFTKNMKSRHTWKHRARAFGAGIAVKTVPSLSQYMGIKYAKWRYDKGKYFAKNNIINKAYFDTNELRSFLEAEHMPMSHNEFPTSLRFYQKNHVCRPHTYRRTDSELMAGLRFKVDYRYPMADIRLLQFMISIPMEVKISSDLSRRVFRLGMEGFLPDSIRLRDIKTAGSLKPMAKYHKRLHENSKLDLWYALREAECIPFLNHKLLDKWMNSRKSPFRLYDMLILGQLGLEKKLMF